LFEPVEDKGSEICLVSGQDVKVRMSISSARSNVLPVRLNNVTFGTQIYDNDKKQIDDTSDVRIDLKSGSKTGNVLYSGDGMGKLTEMGPGNKIGVGFVLQASIKDRMVGDTVPANLGIVSCNWSPLPLKLAESVVVANCPDIDPLHHGPLPSCVSGPIEFLNPTVAIQVAPFTVVCDFPASARVGVPTTVSYTITNSTSVHQHVAVEMDDVYENSIIIDGMKSGSLQFGPGETRHLKYNAVFLQAGKTRMPNLKAVSRRHQSFVIAGSFLESDGGGNLFVSP
jgi:hypothetical protein